MPTYVHLSMLLRKEHRGPEGVAVTQRLAADLGLEPTTGGLASLSFRVPVETFTRLFGGKPSGVPPRAPGSNDFGAPGGYQSQDLPIPPSLQPYVEFIGVVPPSTRLS